MTRLALPACALLLAAPAFAAPPAKPGKAVPAPAASGSGRASFRMGEGVHSLPLRRQEVKAAGGLFRVTLEFADGAGNSLHLVFSAKGVGPVSDRQVAKVEAQSRIAGPSRAAAGRTRCGLVLTALSDREVAGRASCRPMFATGSTPAYELTGLEFAARPK